ncbi:MAG: DNA topoisomerase VI subunit B [Candidatus Latescibacterota bacterium]|nr:MAG: DNA topoisomerase VI subunit B [Candidatus Latescibacterota bacterium]
MTPSRGKSSKTPKRKPSRKTASGGAKKTKRKPSSRGKTKAKPAKAGKSSGKRSSKTRRTTTAKRKKVTAKASGKRVKKAVSKGRAKSKGRGQARKAAKPRTAKPTTRRSPGAEGSIDGLPLFDNETTGAAAETAVQDLSPAVIETPVVEVEAPAGKAPPAAKKGYQTAKSIAKRQREISISEFFAKNRHLLGFDSLPKALLTAVKEAVDNSLDACEEAGITPDLLVEIREIAENRYILRVGDSGPGIVKSQVPKIFGKLLYGSKFHILKQARGQQGIGISAAVMYSQLTTGKPVKVIAKTNPARKGHVYELQIHTKTNTPVIVSEDTIEWDQPHGTLIEMELLAAYKKGIRSVDSYLHQVALANPHARIVYRPPRGDQMIYERLTEQLPVEAKAIKPHPHGVELGVLLDMLKMTKARNVKGFLEREFSRMSARASVDVLEKAGVPPKTSPKRITRDQADKLIQAFAGAKIMKPPTDCLSPIGEDLLVKSVEREVEPDFFTAVTRPPAVYRGNPFQIEVALAYGGPKLADEEIIKLNRFANRAPLVYQQSACAITNGVINTAWRGYGVAQSRGALPSGPMLILVHIASAWVPFTSESKEAIAHYPEIIKEIKLALQECGRRLARFIRRGVRAREEAKKRSYIEQYIPHIGAALREILSFSEREEQRVVAKLSTTLERSRKN